VSAEHRSRAAGIIAPSTLRTCVGRLHLARPGRVRTVGDAFARALARRYEVGHARHLGMALELRRAAPGVTVQPVHHHTHVQVAPRLVLSLLAWPRSPAGATEPAGTARSRPPAPELWLPRRTAAGIRQTITMAADPAPPERLVRRLSARGERIVEVWPDLGAGATTAVRPSAALPVARVVLRQAGRPAGSDHAPSRPDSSPSTARGWSASTGDAPQKLPASIDLHRLTDQVVQAIDRRIIANRERMGRI
jgi:hypothetical protein